MVNKKIKVYDKQLSKTIKVLQQTGHIISLPRDRSRYAKLPGKRISDSGDIYWETRKNRSDAPLKDT